LAIIAHEIPQEVGDYIVLVNAGFSKQRALLYNALSGLAAVVGGVLGYVLIEPWQEYLPYLMVVAASSFIYVAVADLIPQLQKRLHWRETVAQIFWLGAGLLLIGSIVQVLHHEHDHGAEAPAAHSVAHGASEAVGRDAGHHDEHRAHD
ncbi:MAG TPA: ZIP family metal transporter, partial [Aquabacterium sp.]|uniref:ZIP family metal transporter n=1 Tax=Aquabacterium sp. TaxID=1872578 RepID=UPI002E2EEA6C